MRVIDKRGCCVGSAIRIIKLLHAQPGNSQRIVRSVTLLH